MLSLLLFLLPLCFCTPLTPSSSSKPLPLILWHGLGDSFDADGIASVGDLAREVNPGTFVYNIALAEDGAGDRTATFFGNVTEQLAQVCDDLASHPVLSKATAVNALGFSQGGQFLRGYVERCNKPPVRNLVTFGSQHNGISSFQNCAPTNFICQFVKGLLDANAWTDYAQSSLVPAQYYRDPEEMDEYLEHSNFLADINNERKEKNKQYKKNIASLEKLVMYMFEDDKTVIPKESAFFAEVNVTSEEVTPLRERTLYKEDWLGLKELDKKGGLVFDTTPGEHMQLDDKVLRKAFSKYFSPGEGKAAKAWADL